MRICNACVQEDDNRIRTKQEQRGPTHRPFDLQPQPAAPEVVLHLLESHVDVPAPGVGGSDRLKRPASPVPFAPTGPTGRMRCPGRETRARKKVGTALARRGHENLGGQRQTDEGIRDIAARHPLESWDDFHDYVPPTPTRQPIGGRSIGKTRPGRSAWPSSRSAWATARSATPMRG